MARRRSTDEHERRVLGAVGRAQGDTAEIEQRQDVREGQLVLQRDAEDVELAQLALRLERHEWKPALAQLRLHVRLRCERALARNARLLVEQRVDDLRPE